MFFMMLRFGKHLTELWEISKCIGHKIGATLSNGFSWCSGYHICLTHRRSPVRSRAKTLNFFVSYFHFIYLFDFQKYTPVFLYLFIFNPFIFVYIWLILQCSKVKFNRWKKLWIFHQTIFCIFFRIPWAEWKCIVHVLTASGCIFRIKSKIIAPDDMASKQVTMRLKPFWVTFFNLYR